MIRLKKVLNIVCRLSIIFIVITANTNFVYAQGPPDGLIKIIVSPDHDDWVYKTGEKPRFDIVVLKSNIPLKNARIYYEIGPEKMAPFKTDSMTLISGKTVIGGWGLKEPGFLRCTVSTKINGVLYKGLATAGFDPYHILTYTQMPTDFEGFWKQGINDLSKIPMDAKMVLLADRCTANTNVYQVSLQGYVRGSKLYGILCIPKKEGKYPALLRVPGAGVRAYSGEIGIAEKGVITLEIGIHGIPVTMEPSVYVDLANGALNGYQNFNLDDKDKFYYKRVYLNCLRANDFLTTLPQYDGRNLGVIGGSQGGALSIITAALDTRVKYLSVMYPALCDLTATLHGRAGGWPRYFEGSGMTVNNKPDKLNTMSYYDVINFAKLLKVPGIYSSGFNDEIVPPSSAWAAYNAITAPKEFIIVPETGHWGFTEQNEKVSNWMVEQLKKK